MNDQLLLRLTKLIEEIQLFLPHECEPNPISVQVHKVRNVSLFGFVPNANRSMTALKITH